jgi:thiamine biosynthesis protein ThiI
MIFVSLISSGIDSPVATYLLSKKADELILVHADGRPFTDNREIDNFVLIVKHLKKQVSCDIKTYVVPHGKTLYSFKQNCDDKFTCVFCKRMLLRYAERIAMNDEADAIIMGDSLGQVASQTLQNIRTVEQAISLPILRPLIGFDKEDIIKIAKEIGTYDLSILPSDSCSAVPHKPSTKAKLEKILECEEKIDVGKLVNHAVNNLEVAPL